MIAADGIAGAFSLVLALLMLAGMLSTWLLLLLLTVRSAAQAFHGTSLMALMPELVPERDMVRINTLDQSLTSASAIVGPVARHRALYDARVRCGACDGCDLRRPGLRVPRFRQAPLRSGTWRFFRKRCEGPCAWAFDLEGRARHQASSAVGSRCDAALLTPGNALPAHDLQLVRRRWLRGLRR